MNKIQTEIKVFLLVVFVATIVAVGTILVLRAISPSVPERTPTAQQARESNEKGGQWEAIIENGFIVVREIDNDKEIARIPQGIYTKFVSNRSSYRGEGEWSVVKGIINENLRKLYVFVSDPEYSGATGNLVGDIIESEFDGTNLRRISSWGGTKFGLRDFKFSAEDKFLSFYEIWREGAGSYSGGINIVSIDDENASYGIGPPRNKDECIELVNTQYPDGIDGHKINDYEINAVIGSYKWIDETTIEFIFFCESSIDQLSPDEIWQYNLQTEEYKFIK